MTQPKTPAEAMLADLEAEGFDLEALVSGLDAAGWAAPTPAEGWTVRDSIAHLHHSDRAALVALDGRDLDAAATDAVLVPSFDGTDADLFAEWHATRLEVAKRLADLPAGVRIPWFGPPMSVLGFASARLMETWAHGQDVADTLGVLRRPGARLRHVCEIGFRTRGWSYLIRGLTPPGTPVRVALTAPDGSTWTWGQADAPDTVTGPALDFALLVTQRRNRADLSLAATGQAAEGWLAIAQAFAGNPSDGRPPLNS